MDEIVKLLWERNECAIELLESRYSRVCRSIVARFLNDPQDVEEVLSDICMQIWNSIPLAKPRHFTAYLAKTARNAALHRMDITRRRSALRLRSLLMNCLSAYPTNMPQRTSSLTKSETPWIVLSGRCARRNAAIL